MNCCLLKQEMIWSCVGRYLVAEAGVLLCRMTQLKQKDEMWFLGVDTGFNTLIRPTLYDSYHHIVNLTRLDAPNIWKVDVVGVICEVSSSLILSLPLSRW
jgi:diaminopimelate decarboxylase/aspartate kinase